MALGRTTRRNDITAVSAWCHGVLEYYDSLGCCAASVGGFRRFGDSMAVLFSRLGMSETVHQTRFPGTLVTNYQLILDNMQEDERPVRASTGTSADRS